MIYKTRLKIAKRGYMVISALFCILGLVLIFMPDFSLEKIYRIGGIMLAAFGIIKIVGYFSEDLYRLAFQFDLAIGILLIVLGFVLALNKHILFLPIRILLGIFILGDALLKIQTAIDAKRFGIEQWWIIIMASAVAGITGLLLLCRYYESTLYSVILLGASLLAEGVLNLITTITAVEVIRDREQGEKI